MSAKPDELVHAVTVRAPRAEAFSVFVERQGEWWPRQFTFGEERFQTALVEPREGGRWFERDLSGAEVDWGEVRAWQPPGRVVLSWRVSPERTQEPKERASEIEVRFTAVESAKTRVEVTHQDFANHGHGGKQMREGMASDQGWPGLLDRYRQLAEEA